MLDPAEASATTAQFGVSHEQVRRDHLLSHLLAALSDQAADHVIFFGGTALARTHLPHGRLSEDLDLIAVPSRATAVAAVQKTLAGAARREYGRLIWLAPLQGVREVLPGVLRTPDGLTVRVQLLEPVGFPAWPTERRRLIQRYADAAPAVLEVPTLASFAASKTSAWHDRRAPRDLYDLWGLAAVGALDAHSAALFARSGPTGGTPAPWMFEDAPAPDDWHAQLAGQTRLAVGPARRWRSCGRLGPAQPPTLTVTGGRNAAERGPSSERSGPSARHPSVCPDVK